MIVFCVYILYAANVLVVKGEHSSTGRVEEVEISNHVHHLFKRAASMSHHVSKRAVPPVVAEKALEIGGELAGKAAEELFDKIGEAGDRAAGYLENGASVDVQPQNGFMSDDLLAPPAWHVGIGVENDNDEEKSTEQYFSYPMGIGAVMWNGCYGTDYKPGDPCYNSRQPPLGACVNLLDAASFIGVGFDGRGEYSPDSRKMSIIQRNCAGLSTYDGYDVPDTMNVHGIYDTKSRMLTFEDRNEYSSYLQSEAGISGSFLFASAGVSTAYGRSRVSNEQKYLSMFDIDVVRYEVFKELTTANDLSVEFIKAFMSLPTDYYTPGNPKKFQDFIQRWGTHYVKSGIFGGRLELKKVASASFYSSVESFAVEAKVDFDAFFASFHAKVSHKQGSTSAQQTSYSSTTLEAFGGDQEIAAVLTDAGSPTIKSDLVNWLNSIPDYPKAIQFGVAPITDLLYFRAEDVFPTKEFSDCNDIKGTKKDTSGNKFYFIERIVANETVKEKVFCRYQTRKQLMDDIAKRRESLDRAISVYMSEGLVSDAEISVAGGGDYCEFRDIVTDSNTEPPTWEYIMSGDSFTVIFDMEMDMKGGFQGSKILKDDVLTIHNFVGKWFVEKSDGTARLGEGYGNGGSNDTDNMKISVEGLVLTFIPEASLFMLTDDDYTASLEMWPGLFERLKNLFVARVEWPISLRTAKAEEKNFLNSVVKTFPCNTQWSNIQTFETSHKGLCLHFSAVSEGSIYVVFASVPKDKKTWYYVEITPTAAAIHKYNQVLTETSHTKARGLGDSVLQQYYFVCITIQTGGETLIEYGKFKAEDKQTIYLSYVDKHSPMSPMFYGFGSGSEDVSIFHATAKDRQPLNSTSISCGPGTIYDDINSLCLLNCDVTCDADYGCMISESAEPSPQLCNECKSIKQIKGTVFECVEVCPIPTIIVDGKSICPCKWVVTADGNVCVETCPTGLQADPDTGICIEKCPDPDDVENSVREGDDFSYGASVTYKCLYGYVMIGKRTIACDNGIWSPSSPKCIHRPVITDLQPLWKLLNGRMYYVNMYGHTYGEARQICLDLDSQLVTINDGTENTALREHIQPFDTYRQLWIGLNDIQTEGQFKWVDGSTSVYRHFDQGEPNDINKNEDCAVFKSNGFWNDRTCFDDNVGFICEKGIQKAADSELQPLWELVNGRLYYVNIYGHTYDEARQRCLDLDSHLVTVGDGNENTDLNEHLKTFGTGLEFWIGLNDIETEGQFKWEDGSTSAYRSWQPLEPNDFENAEDCAIVRLSGLWNDVDCSKYAGFVCETGYTTIGCYKDTTTRAIPLLEHKLDGDYWTRVNPIAKCADAARDLGNQCFAVQNGGQCFSSSTACDTYDRYGPSTGCKADGEGGPNANQVYRFPESPYIDKTWRDDGRCGVGYQIPDGRIAECSPWFGYPCCWGSYCVQGRGDCNCPDCTIGSN